MTTFCNTRIPTNSSGLRTYGDKHPIPAPNFRLGMEKRLREPGHGRRLPQIAAPSLVLALILAEECPRAMGLTSPG